MINCVSAENHYQMFGSALCGVMTVLMSGQQRVNVDHALMRKSSSQTRRHIVPEYAADKLCTCSHPASEHHQCWYPGGYHEYAECESWDEQDMDYSCHCQNFTPVAIPMGQHASS